MLIKNVFFEIVWTACFVVIHTERASVQVSVVNNTLDRSMHRAVSKYISGMFHDLPAVYRDAVEDGQCSDPNNAPAF